MAYISQDKKEEEEEAEKNELEREDQEHRVKDVEKDENEDKEVDVEIEEEKVEYEGEEPIVIDVGTPMASEINLVGDGSIIPDETAEVNMMMSETILPTGNEIIETPEENEIGNVVEDVKLLLDDLDELHLLLDEQTIELPGTERECINCESKEREI